MYDHDAGLTFLINKLNNQKPANLRGLHYCLHFPPIRALNMHLQELKAKSPADLLAYAEDLEIENASTLRKQDMMFAILKQLADNDVAIYGSGVLEVLSDGFGFLRAPESNYLPGPDDIYVSPSQVRRFGALVIPLKVKSERQKMANVILHY